MPPPSALHRSWHALDPKEALGLLDGDAERGLASAEAARRLAQVGPNRIAGQEEPSLGRLAARQFRSVVVLLLLAASGIALGLGEWLEAGAILIALLLNAAIGFATEWRAQRSLAALRALAVPRAIVRRDGQVSQVPAAALVPGDLVILEAGAYVPADARLIRSAGLQVAEAALTGESIPVDKDAEAALRPDAPIAERITMVYLGTAVVAGSAVALVTATGQATELGRIGQLVALVPHRETPLEREVERLGRRLIVLALAVCGVVGLTGIFHGEPVWLMLETAVTLAIAAIPESLPAVTAVALAAGLWRLARRGALVRRLHAVETLGSTTVICADKTGTMTENRLTVTRIRLGEREIQVSGGGLSPAGDFLEGGKAVAVAEDPHLRLALTVGALVNNASLEARRDGSVALHGDPTEGALLVAALKGGIGPSDLARQWTRLSEIPFDPTARLMATVNRSPDGKPVAMLKGAPGRIVEASTFRLTAAGVVPLTDADRAAILEANRALAGEGLRVLALAWRPDLPEGAGPTERLTFIGLVGFSDPIRPGVREAILRCRVAGLRPLMLTGDQKVTAETVGTALGLAGPAVDAREIHDQPLPALARIAAGTEVFSRVSPEEKLRLVQALQADGAVVAMTGDGVNDAPALARADIGVAMGRRGTDVAREAADLVLTDDDFATIVSAVEEGRVIYANLRKVIHFLFSCNLSEIVTVFIGILLGLPAPLLPLQILWINLVTDILPAMALIRDPAEPDVMRRPPRDPREALLTWRFGGRILGEGALLAAGVLSVYLWAVWQEGPGPRAATLAFVALVLIHPFQAMRCRSDRLGWWRLPPNRLLWASLAALVGLQVLATSWRPLARLLGTVPLAGSDWLVLSAAVLWPVLLMEILKGWHGSAARARSDTAHPN